MVMSRVAETPMPYGALKRHPIPISDTREYQVAETPMPYGALKPVLVFG